MAKGAAATPEVGRDEKRAALAAAAVVLAVTLGLFLLAPLVAATPFWVEHFPDSDPRLALVVTGAFLFIAHLPALLRPLTWDAELTARALRALAWGFAVHYALAVLLAAPRLAAIVIAPLLVAPPLGLVRAARDARDLGARAVLHLSGGAGAAAAFALLLVVLAWSGATAILAAVAALVLAMLYTLVPWLAAPAARRAATTVPTPHPLDVPAGTLEPPVGWFPLVLTLAAVVFVLLVVAPGVPLTAPVAWLTVVLALPLVARAALRRRGLVHPRGLAGPPGMRRHEARVEVLADDVLDELDESVARFLRWGTGRTLLAARLARVIAGDDEATRRHVEARLRSLPRSPWARRRRTEGIVRLLRDGGIVPGGGAS